MLRSLIRRQTEVESEGGSDVASRPEKAPRLEQPADGVVWYIHRSLKKVHLLRGQSEKPLMDRVLACGRMLSDTCTRASQEQQGMSRCAMCARNFQEVP